MREVPCKVDDSVDWTASVSVSSLNDSPWHIVSMISSLAKATKGVNNSTSCRLCTAITSPGVMLELSLAGHEGVAAASSVSNCIADSLRHDRTHISQQVVSMPLWLQVTHWKRGWLVAKGICRSGWSQLTAAACMYLIQHHTPLAEADQVKWRGICCTRIAYVV
jgi:hypothetical protein